MTITYDDVAASASHRFDQYHRGYCSCHMNSNTCGYHILCTCSSDEEFDQRYYVAFTAAIQGGIEEGKAHEWADGYASNYLPKGE